MDIVSLMCQVEFTTVPVEQAHGSVSAVHRYHPSLGEQLLCLRGHAHQLRSLWLAARGSTSANTPMASRSCQHNHITGRNIFFKELVASKSWHGLLHVDQAEKESLMSLHVSMWQVMPQSQKRHYMAEARRLRNNLTKDHAEQDRSSALLATLCRQRAEEVERNEQGLSLLRRNRLSEDDVETLAERLRANTSQVGVAKKWLAMFVTSPEPPSVTMQNAVSIFSGAVTDDHSITRVPHWWKLVCRNRASFAHCIIRRSADPHPTYCHLLVAYCNPLHPVFLKVELVRDQLHMSWEPSSWVSSTYSRSAWEKCLRLVS